MSVPAFVLAAVCVLGALGALAWRRGEEPRTRRAIAAFFAVLALFAAFAALLAFVAHTNSTREAERTALDPRSTPAPGERVLLAGTLGGDTDPVAIDECDVRSCIERRPEQLELRADGVELRVMGRGYERREWPVEWRDEERYIYRLRRGDVVVEAHATATPRRFDRPTFVDARSIAAVRSSHASSATLSLSLAVALLIAAAALLIAAAVSFVLRSARERAAASR